MSRTSTLKWVTDDGLDGGLVTVTVTPAGTGLITSSGGLSGSGTKAVSGTGSVAATAAASSSGHGPKTSTLKWVTDDGIDGGPVTVTVVGSPVVNEITGSVTLSASGTKAAQGNGYLDWTAEVSSSGVANPTFTAATATLTLTARPALMSATAAERTATAATLTLTPAAALVNVVGAAMETAQLTLTPAAIAASRGAVARTLPRADLLLVANAAKVVEADLVFLPPTVEEGPAGGGPLFRRYKLNRGVTVLKNGATFTEVRYPTQDQIANADRAYLGGYVHVVTREEAADLRAAGYVVSSVS